VPTLSIVSGTFNRKQALQNMMQSARDTLPLGITLEFVIVDGGSDDGTLDWLHEQPDVVTIEHGELRGAIPAFCDGANAASGKYVVMANDDILFRPGALLAGILHLEEHANCGGVAFADNRKSAYNTTGKHQVQMMPAHFEGKYQGVRYAQVGMFRKWLGDQVGWWGADDPDFNARTYGGDNYLSSRIWELGYTIDENECCKVDDLVIDDTLRAINNGPAHNKEHDDTKAYYDRYPDGAALSREMLVEQQDIRSLRILYMPIYERGHEIQKTQKRGLRDALSKVAWVYEWDYQSSLNPGGEMLTLLADFQPDMILSQLHSADIITKQIARSVRQRYKKLLWVNWNGDYWPDGLTSPAMLDLLGYINLQLTINGSVLPIYKGHGIPAAYWQIGYEEPGDDLPDVKSHDVVFLANAYHPQRKELEKVLRGMEGVDVGLYGSGWEQPDGQCLYDFATGKALYNNAKIAIGDNMYPDAPGFVSNRLFQAMAAGGCLLLHQEVPQLEQLTGLVEAYHYKSWSTIQELPGIIQSLLEHENARKQAGKQGTQFVREHHSFDARVRELFTNLIPLADKPLQDMIGLRYTGKQKTQFSVRGLTHRYTCIPGQTLFVDNADADRIMKHGVFEIVADIAPDDRLARGVPN
jgi:glycosyltransferase involved in cell wall biosynthesis